MSALIDWGNANADDVVAHINSVLPEGILDRLRVVVGPTTREKFIANEAALRKAAYQEQVVNDIRQADKELKSYKPATVSVLRKCISDDTFEATITCVGSSNKLGIKVGDVRYSIHSPSNYTWRDVTPAVGMVLTLEFDTYEDHRTETLRPMLAIKTKLDTIPDKG